MRASDAGRGWFAELYDVFVERATSSGVTAGSAGCAPSAELCDVSCAELYGVFVERAGAEA